MDDHDSIREWLEQVPNRLLAAERRAQNNLRRNRRRGRPKAMRAPTCSEQMGVRDLRKHAAYCTPITSPE